MNQRLLQARGVCIRTKRQLLKMQIRDVSYYQYGFVEAPPAHKPPLPSEPQAGSSYR